MVNYSHAFGYYLLTENKSSDLNTPVYFSRYAITSAMASQMAFCLKTSNRIKSWGANTRGKKPERSQVHCAGKKGNHFLPQLSNSPALTLTTQTPSRKGVSGAHYGLGGLDVRLIWGQSMGGWGEWKEKDLGGLPSVWEGVTGASTLLCIKEHSRGPQQKRP